MMIGFAFIFILVLAAGAYALGWRPQLNLPGPSQPGQTALEILNTRYAHGEISREEYDEMRRVLEV